MRVCTIDGCDRRHSANGRCASHNTEAWRRENPDYNREYARESRWQTRYNEGRIRVTIVATEASLLAALNKPEVFATPGATP